MARQRKLQLILSMKIVAGAGRNDLTTQKKNSSWSYKKITAGIIPFKESPARIKRNEREHPAGVRRGGSCTLHQSALKLTKASLPATAQDEERSDEGNKYLKIKRAFCRLGLLLNRQRSSSRWQTTKLQNSSSRTIDVKGIGIRWVAYLRGHR